MSRPGSRLGKVDLSRLEPLKSNQVGFRWRHRQIYLAQFQLVLCQVELKIQQIFCDLLRYNVCLYKLHLIINQ
jgi:hypothetical protein